MRNRLPFTIPPNLSFIIPVKRITRLAFCGGGVEGAAYPDAIIAMKELGLINHIDTVAGSSAGAFMALLVALGCTTEEIKTITDEINFAKFMDFSSKNNEAIKTIIQNKVNHHIDILASMVQFVYNEKDFLIDFNKSTLLTMLAQLKNKRPFTFANLSQLSDFYKIFFPKENIIKDIIISGTNITDEKLTLFSTRTSPEMEIARAIHISAAFAIFFKSADVDSCKIHFVTNQAELLQALHHDYSLRTLGLSSSESSASTVHDYFVNRTDEAACYCEKDLLSSLLQIMHGVETVELYDAIARPVIAANPAASTAHKAVIKEAVSELASKVFEINLVKDMTAHELIGRVKAVSQVLQEYFEFYAYDSADLKIVKASKVEAGIQQLQKLLQKYTDLNPLTELTTGTEPQRQLVILMDRLKPQQALFNQLVDLLSQYAKMTTHKKTAKKTQRAAQLIESLDYFTLLAKKQAVISLLTTQKNKYFQSSKNSKLLSQVIIAIRAAKDIKSINKALTPVKPHYKLHTLFSIRKSAHAALSHPRSAKVLKRKR
jgi:hypothetical protein